MDPEALETMYAQIEEERIKENEELDRLAEESLKAGTLALDEKLLEQTKKVNRLVLTSQRLEKMLEETPD